MLPNADYLPAGLPQGVSNFLIPGSVPADFSLPIAHIGFWHFEMARIAVPKIRIDKYCNFLSSEKDVRFAEDCFWVGGKVDAPAL